MKTKDPPMIGVQDLAKILDDLFEEDNWGDVDPYLFKGIATGVDWTDDPDTLEVQDALRNLLEKAVIRINALVLGE